MGLSDMLRTSRTNLIPSIMQFPSVDIDSLKKRLKLKERGREQGTQNLPSPDNEALDPVEREIVAAIEGTGREQYDAYLAHQKTYAERAADTTVQGQVLRISSVAGGAIADFQRTTNQGTGDLYARKRAVILTEAELNNFRRRHHLERPPRDYGSKALKVWFLVLLLGIEAVLNGFFLSKGSEFGLVGGVLEALLIAGLNIALGVIVGRFVAPWLSYQNPFARILAALGIIVFLAAAFGFNLAVAHYRTAMSGDPFEASFTAYRHLRESPFGIEDLESWALFVMGFLFSMGAAYDGWRMDDPYPGYGQRMRHNLEALEDYNSLKEDLLYDLDEIKKKSEEEIDDLTRSITSRQGEFGSIVMRSEALRSAMREHFDHLESAANTLLVFYRNENEKHRPAQSPLPARFKDASAWPYPRPSLEGGVVSEDGRKRIDDALNAALQDIPKQRDALYKAFGEALGEYKKIDDIVKVGDTPATEASI